jgi:hypothetical protein
MQQHYQASSNVNLGEALTGNGAVSGGAKYEN